jgi:hypothetical protein
LPKEVQTKNVSTKKLPQKLSYEKASGKILVKLTNTGIAIRYTPHALNKRGRLLVSVSRQLSISPTIYEQRMKDLRAAFLYLQFRFEHF